MTCVVLRRYFHSYNNKRNLAMAIHLESIRLSFVLCVLLVYYIRRLRFHEPNFNQSVGQRAIALCCAAEWTLYLSDLKD